LNINNSGPESHSRPQYLARAVGPVGAQNLAVSGTIREEIQIKYSYSVTIWSYDCLMSLPVSSQKDKC